MKRVVLFLVLLWGCSPQSLEDYYHEGQTVAKKITDDLRHIHSREDLEMAIPALKKRFDELVNLMIDAREYQEKHPEEFFEEEAFAFSIDDELLEELKRIYEIEKGKELIEKAEREALLRLDAYKRNLLKNLTKPV
jgi:hypothetical protein